MDRITKVSSEEDYDELLFFIDGVNQGNWSGENGWTTVEFPITSPGLHTFTWSYGQDKSDSAGSDAAWVDNIEFFRK
jgi:hypothetical protein